MVDNNDDIESEDDNDSADAAAEGEEDAEPEEATADNMSDAESPLITTTATPSPRSTPPSGDFDPPLSCPTVRTDTSGSSTEGRRKKEGVGDDPLVVATRATAAAQNRPRHDYSAYGNNSGSGDKDGEGAGGDGGEGDTVENKNPWAGIEWGQAEGESGGAVRRWGRVVQEGDGYGSNGIETSGDLEPPSSVGEDMVGESGIEARPQSSASLEKRGRRVDNGEGSSQAGAVTAATGEEGAVRGPPPQSGSKKGRRRASLSRAPKSSAMSKGRW